MRTVGEMTMAFIFCGLVFWAVVIGMIVKFGLPAFLIFCVLFAGCFFIEWRSTTREVNKFIAQK
jgi:hypothetical protein